MICNLGSVPRVADRIRSLSRLGLSNVVAVHGLSKLQEIIRVVRRTPRPGCWLPTKSSLPNHCRLPALLPVVGPDGGVSGVLHHHPRVVTDPVLSPVLVPGIVHSEPTPVPRIGLVLPAIRSLERGEGRAWDTCWQRELRPRCTLSSSPWWDSPRCTDLDTKHFAGFSQIPPQNPEISEGKLNRLSDGEICPPSNRMHNMKYYVPFHTDFCWFLSAFNHLNLGFAVSSRWRIIWNITFSMLAAGAEHFIFQFIWIFLKSV